MAIAAFEPAFSDDHGSDERKAKREELKNLSPEERKAYHEERKAKWEALSDAEKIEAIEKKRAEKRKASDEKWDSMSDAEKIAFVEERRKNKHEKRKKHRKGEKSE